MSHYRHFFHVRIQEFSSGGVQVRLTKKALTTFFFFSPQLILRKSNGQFQRNLSFFKVPEWVQHFPGGVQLFPGGSNCLFPIETHITCDFPGGSGPPVPPSGSALDFCVYTVCKSTCLGVSCIQRVSSYFEWFPILRMRHLPGIRDIEFARIKLYGTFVFLFSVLIKSAQCFRQ